MRMMKLLALIVVSSFLFACGDDDVLFVASGNKTFIADGGSADNSVVGTQGGYGGGIYMDVYGDVKVKKTGTVDTSFSIPSYAYHFGSNKATVTVDTTVKLQGTDTIAAGDLYLISGDTNLYVSNGETGTVVSGLEVKPGVTLTVPANWDTWAYFIFEQSVQIDGTVRTAADAVDLDMESGSLFIVGSRGVVTTKSSNAGVDGGDIYLYSESVFINKGVIDASGSDNTGGNGGNAGYAWADADSLLYNTGTLLSMGGDGSVNGGSGNGIGLYSYFASVYTSGVLDCSGGDGAGGSGGYAGTEYGIDLQAGADYEGSRSIGSLVVGGTLTANGGNGTGGNGGQASLILLESNGGKLWTSAAITARGGAGTGAGNYGSNGGWVRMFADYGEFDGEFSVDTWGIKITGNIDLSGGPGVTFGGWGGRLEVRNNISGADIPTGPAVQMVGYKGLSMNGGSGYNGGWAGGYFYGGGYMIMTRDWFTGYGVALPVGSISNGVPASLVGGSADSAAGTGGLGGMVQFMTLNYMGHGGEVTAQNSAPIDVSGGDGYSALYAGGVFIYGYNKTSNSGVITALGGDGAIGGYGPGYEWYGIYLMSSYDVLNSGAIKGSGGFGVQQGGYGGQVAMIAGSQVKNKASVTMNGGDSEQYGGYGGLITMVSELIPTSNSGSLKVKGGVGGTADGLDGYIYIDGVDVGPVH